MSYSDMFAENQVTTMPGITTIMPQQGRVIGAISPKAAALVAKAMNVKDGISVSEFGTEAGKKVAELADVVLKKTTTGKMDEFGKGITDILVLTSQVNIDDLNIDKTGGMVNKLTSFFKKKRVEVLAQFQNTSTQIQKVVDVLGLRQVAMKEDNKFLDQLYEANMVEYHDLGFSIEAAEYALVEMNAQYAKEQIAASTSTDQFFIQSVSEMENHIKRWEKQVDRLKRMQYVALLTAPEIRQIQSGNVSTVEKFDDLINTTIPAWKKQLSMTILAMNQKANAELGTAMDDKTNAFFKKAAELNNSNAVAVAKSAERSSVDIETLAFMQQKMIDSVKQVKAIQDAGRTERAAASVRIGTLRDEMKKEMLTW